MTFRIRVAKYQQCTRCVMDTTAPLITFNEQGVCCYCTEYFEKGKAIGSPRSMPDVIQEIRDRSEGEYHAIAGISGGIDSAYSTYQAHENGLDLLLVHVDDGWNTKEAWHNVQTIVNATEYDFVHIKVNQEEYHDLIRAYLKAGVVGIECITDNAMRCALYDQAKKHTIKNILSGGNFVTEALWPRGSWGYDNNDARNIKAIHKRYGTIPIKDMNFLGILRRTWNLKLGGMREFRLLNHIHYDRARAIDTLQDVWGFKPYGHKHHENIFTRFIEAYWIPMRFGVDKRRAHYSALVCAGQMSREEALMCLERLPLTVEQAESDRQFFLSKLGMTLEEYEGFLHTPKRSHYEFATHKWEKRALWAVGWLLRTPRRLFRR